MIQSFCQYFQGVNSTTPFKFSNPDGVVKVWRFQEDFQTLEARCRCTNAEPTGPPESRAYTEIPRIVAPLWRAKNC